MPIAFQVVQELIPRDAGWVPQIIPTVEGGVQLEWHRDGFDLEIEITCTGEIYADYEDESGQAWEGEYAEVGADVAKVFERSVA
jgi:hypothetical protein